MTSYKDKNDFIWFFKIVSLYLNSFPKYLSKDLYKTKCKNLKILTWDWDS